MNEDSTDVISTVAITGAAGSLGEAIVDQILERLPNTSVIGIDLVKPRRKRNSSRVSFIKRDVRDTDLAKDLKGVDALIHLAFIVEKPGRLSADEIESINVGGSQNVFSACASAGVKQIVYASSVAAYGMHRERHNTILTEEQELRGNPDFYYSHHKSLVEHWLNRFEAENKDMIIARLRPCIFAGERSPTRPVHLLSHVPIIPRITGFDDVQLQLAHEDDIATAFYLALVKKAHGSFNLTSEGSLAMKDIAPALGKRSFPLPKAFLYFAIIFYKLKISPWDPGWLIKAGRASVVMSAEKARKELGWKPKYGTPEEVLRALVSK